MENTKPIPRQTWRHKESGNIYDVVFNFPEVVPAGGLRRELRQLLDKSNIQLAYQFSKDTVFYSHAGCVYVRREADFLDKFELIEKAK
jgi:hypothetical protein